jgi:F-type H+-transporting ATPase subunit delta
MKNQVLVKRYGLGFLSAAATQEEYASLFRELEDFYSLVKREKGLREILTSPFIPASKKQKIVQEVLEHIKAQPKVSRFLLLLIENERFELLPELIATLPELWNEEHGVVTFEVSSVILLSEEQKQTLQTKLELIEKGPVALKYRQDPSLIGGLSLRKGNIVYDASLKGDLKKLKEKIIQG